MLRGPAKKCHQFEPKYYVWVGFINGMGKSEEKYVIKLYITVSLFRTYRIIYIRLKVGMDFVIDFKIYLIIMFVCDCQCIEQIST
jgi:hypothetical protein